MRSESSSSWLPPTETLMTRISRRDSSRSPADAEGAEGWLRCFDARRRRDARPIFAPGASCSSALDDVFAPVVLLRCGSTGRKGNGRDSLDERHRSGVGPLTIDPAVQNRDAGRPN